MTTTRRETPTTGPEATQLRAWLDFHRDTLRMKCEGLDREQLARTLAPSTLTLGGLMKHMALVEDNWFSFVLLDRDRAPAWQGVDWDADPDWDFHSAREDSPEELRRLFDEMCAASDAILDEVGDDLDRRSARTSHHRGTVFDLRWILLHMIEEYARHNGHADLIRESIDGAVGD
jgi:uncharacterized damage-inducible protein DinB